MEWAIQQARADGFARLSMNVWQDNAAARALCEQAGFRLRTRIEVPPHPGLSHTGGSLLLVLELG